MDNSCFEMVLIILNLQAAQYVGSEGASFASTLLPGYCTIVGTPRKLSLLTAGTGVLRVKEIPGISPGISLCNSSDSCSSRKSLRPLSKAA